MLLEFAGDVVRRVLGLGENDELAGLVEFLVEQVAPEMHEEFVELRVAVDGGPSGNEFVEDGGVAFQALAEAILEIVEAADFDSWVGGLRVEDELEEFVFAVVEDVIGDGEIRGDEDAASVEHLQHGARAFGKASQRFREGEKAAVDALHEHRFHNPRELRGDEVGVLVAELFLRLEESDGAVAVVSQPLVGVREQPHGAVVEQFEFGIELVVNRARLLDIGEDDALSVEVFLIEVVLQKVAAGATDGELLDDAGADQLVDFLDAREAGFHVRVAAREVVSLDARGEEVLQIRRALDGGVFAVLEKEGEVADVLGPVVQRRGGDEDDALFGEGAIGQPAARRRLAEALERVVSPALVVAELVRFIDDHEIEFFRVLDLVDAAVGDDLPVLQLEFPKGAVPSIFERGRDDDECRRDVGGEVVEVEKLLRNQRGDDGFSKADDIGEEEAAVTMQEIEALVDGIDLVREPQETLGEIGDGVRVELDGRAEVFDEEFDV